MIELPITNGFDRDQLPLGHIKLTIEATRMVESMGRSGTEMALVPTLLKSGLMQDGTYNHIEVTDFALVPVSSFTPSNNKIVMET